MNPDAKSGVETNGTLRVNEIFHSIQGESSFAGRPCTFVRLTGCDQRCRWCDTEHAFHQGRDIPVPDILREVKEYGTPLVEVTGGEPLLQPAVHALIRGLLEAGHSVLVETGGSRDISRLDPAVTVILDLKCPGSGMEDRIRWENLPLLKPADQVKFVVGDRQDYEWARGVIERHGLIDLCEVLMSPVHGVVRPEILADWILRDRLQVRLQVQFHKYIWGEDKRGV